MRNVVARKWIAVGLACSAVAVAQEPVVEKVSEHFTVQFHSAKVPAEHAQRIADDASAVAEKSWAVVQKLLQMTESKPAVIHLYAVEKDYRKAERSVLKSTSGMRDMIVDHAAQVAHVAVLPMLGNSDITRLGLPTPVAAHVTRAASELLAVQKSKLAAADPWLASVIGFAVLEGKQAQSPKYGVDPLFDERRWMHGLPSNRRPLRDWALDTRPPADRAQWIWREEAQCLTAQFLVGKSSDWARKLLQDSAKAPESVAAARLAAMERVLGKKWDKIEEPWKKQLEAVDATFAVNSPMFALSGTRYVLVGSEAGSAVVTGVKLPPAGPYRLSATFELAEDDDGGFCARLDWDETTMLVIGLEAGRVSISEWKGGHESLRRELGAPITRGKPAHVSLEVGAEKNFLVVAIDGTEVLRWDCGERGMHGYWSFAKKEIAVYLEGIRVESIKAK